MLRRFPCSLVLSAALVAACGGPDTSNPVAACNAFASAVCNKAQSCGDSNVTSSCTGQLQDALKCAQFTSCPRGSTFDSGAASQCISAVNGLSCNDAANDLVNNTLPSACDSICH